MASARTGGVIARAASDRDSTCYKRGMRWALCLFVACADPVIPESLAPLDREPRFAVISSDLGSSSAISMLDAEAEPIDRRWFDSGTALPGLVAALSGDVVLPTRQLPGSFTVIDRFKTDVVSRFSVPDGDLLGQVRTHLRAERVGFSSNPHDVLFDGTLAWVSRNQPNDDGAAPPINRGDDLVAVDLATMELTEERVDLSALDLHAGGVTYFARPSRMVRAGDRVLVGLDRLDASFHEGASGAIAVVDLETRSAVELPIGGLENCGRVVPVAGDSSRAIVQCEGATFVSNAERRPTAGLALIRVIDGDAVVEHLWRASAQPGDPNQGIPVRSTISVGGTLALAVALGDLVPPHRLTEIDLATGGLRVLYEVGDTGDAVEIGAPCYDPESGIVLLPEASAGLHRFVYTPGEALDDRGHLPLVPELGLPPRAAYFLAL
jgi:hypothetical protein